jgi:hypothetical protein
MNTEFYRLIGSLEAVIHFIRNQRHDVWKDKHGAASELISDPKRNPDQALEDQRKRVEEKLDLLEKVIRDLLDGQAKISHAFYDFRRTMSKNAEGFYHAINFLRRKAPEWQLMDEDLLRLIENYQATASNLFFGGDGYGGNVGSSSS